MEPQPSLSKCWKASSMETPILERKSSAAQIDRIKNWLGVARWMKSETTIYNNVPVGTIKIN